MGCGESGTGCHGHGTGSDGRGTTWRVAVLGTLVAVMAALAPTSTAVAQDVGTVPLEGGTLDPWGGGVSPDAQLVVSDVVVTVEDGYDRVVFETTGEGEAGWDIAYEAVGETSEPVRLLVTITGTVTDPTAAGDVEPFTGDVPGAGGVVTSVADLGGADGTREFAVLLDQQVPYRVTRIGSPKAIAVDVAHVEGSAGGEDHAEDHEVDDEDAPVPAGGVEAGWGATDRWTVLAVTLSLVGLALVGYGVRDLRQRRRRTA
jgi:hypothetical protein